MALRNRLEALVRAGENGLFFGRLAAMDTLSRTARLLQRNATHGGLGFLFDVRLPFASAAPPGKSDALLHRFLEIIVAGWLGCVRFAKRQSAVVQRLLNFL